jgi:hypothetical protein
MNLGANTHIRATALVADETATALTIAHTMGIRVSGSDGGRIRSVRIATQRGVAVITTPQHQQAEASNSHDSTGGSKSSMIR